MTHFDPSAGDVPASGRLVLVFSSSSIPEGLLAKGLLESEGISVFVKGESEGPYRMGPVYLFVPEEVEVQARLALAEAASGARSTASLESAEAAEGSEEEPADPG
jgi:Putative prokaryotic signal transducing protein